VRIEQLKYLLYIAETGSLTKAAEHFYISQQGISYSIKQLEKELDTKIIQYDKTVTFTLAGDLLLAKAREIVDSHNRLQDELTGLRKHTLSEESDFSRAKVKLSTIPIISSTILSEIVAKVKEHSRNTLLTTGEKSRTEILQKFSDSLDNDEIALISLVDAYMTEQFKKRINFKLLYSCNVLVLVSDQCPLAQSAEIGLEEALRYPTILFTNEPVDEKYRDFFNNQSPDIMLQSTNMTICREMIRNNSAIGFTSEFAESFLDTNGLVAVPLKESIKTHYGIICPKEKAPSKESQEVISIIEDIFSSHIKEY
jgi:DNA-binding transcriptional LysR family regulator